MIGQRFARLTVVERVPNATRERYRCRCECGADKEIAAYHLRSGAIRSCGCLLRETTARRNQEAGTHGHATGKQSPTYRSWKAMRFRCENPKFVGWENYGGRGITVCDRWMTFENFLADMGERPDGKTLDRYPNVNGNYEPSNCRWATASEQRANRRPNKRRKAEPQAVIAASRTGVSQRMLSKEFGISQRQIGRILQDASRVAAQLANRRRR